MFINLNNIFQFLSQILSGGKQTSLATLIAKFCMNELVKDSWRAWEPSSGKEQEEWRLQSRQVQEGQAILSAAQAC